MSSENDNPYQPPAVESMLVADELECQPSIQRGFLYAIPIAAIGFAIPFALSIAVALILFYMSYSRLDIESVFNFRRIDLQYFWFGLGCSSVFGLAAFLNYSPSRRIGLIKASMYVGTLMLLLGNTVAAEVVQHLSFQVYSDSYVSYPYALWDTLHFLIAFGITLIYTITHTAIRFRSKPSTNNPTTSPHKD